MAKRPPLDEEIALFKAIVAAEGITTADGAGAGDSIIDAGLIGVGIHSFETMLIVLYPGQPRAVDSIDIIDFDNATGEITFDRSYKDVAGAIPAGTPYQIVTLRSAVAGVNQLLIDVRSVLWAVDMGLRPAVSFYEGWQDEAGLDLTIWTTAIVGTGTVARDVTDPPYLKVILGGTAFDDVADLYSDHRWFCGPDIYNVRTISRKLVMEFEGKFVQVASILTDEFLMGWGATQGAKKTTDNIIGFILDAAADELYTITDDSVGETQKDTGWGAFSLVDWHKYRIEIYAGTVDFYIDDVVVTTHITGEDLPDTAMFQNFYVQQEAAALGGQLHVGIIRIWTEDIVR